MASTAALREHKVVIHRCLDWYLIYLLMRLVAHRLKIWILLILVLIALCDLVCDLIHEV